jgi:hypothetical protein
MTQPEYDDPREYKTKGVFTQTADAEALIRLAATRFKDEGKIASVHNTADDIREMLIVDGTDISRIIVHFEPLNNSETIRVEDLFIVGPDVQDSAETIISRPDLFYHRRSAVPIGDYTEPQVQTKMDFIYGAYEEAMAQGAKKMERTPSQPGAQSLDDKLEDPLDLLSIVVDTSEIDSELLKEVRAAGKEHAGQEAPADLSPETGSPEDLAIAYLEGTNKK